MTAEPIILAHLGAAVVAAGLGIANLVSRKGTPRHRAIGWLWIAAMLGVTLPSFAIRELVPGSFSWIHGLTIWTLVSMAWAIWAIRTGRVSTHKNIMIGLMAGLTIAGVFAALPGRFISAMIGYG